MQGNKPWICLQVDCNYLIKKESRYLATFMKLKPNKRVRRGPFPNQY